MSYKRVESVGEATRHGCVLEITCKRCGRQRWVMAACLQMPLRPDGVRVRHNTPIRRLGMMLVCRGGHGTGIGCQGKGATVRAVHQEMLPTPAGVPKVAWLNADERGRRRLEREARG